MFSIIGVTPARIRELFFGGKRILHQEGFLSLIKVFLFAYETYLVFENSLDGPSFPCKVDNLILRAKFAPFPLEEFQRLFGVYLEGVKWDSTKSLDFSSYPDAQQYRKGLDDGTIVFEAFVGDRLVHRTVVATSKGGAYHCYYPSSICHADTAYAGFSITANEYHGRGILTYIYSEIFRYFREKGFSKVVLAISKNVPVAHKTQHKLGSKLLHEGCYLRFLPLFHFRWIKPYVS